MENVKRSLFGYNKKDVHNLLFEKDQVIDTQKKDIAFLQEQNKQLSSKIKQPQSTNSNNN